MSSEVACWGPYGWGRFYAGLQIAMGLFLLAWLLLFWVHLYPPVRRLMLVGVAVGLPLGYGLWNRARWGLYLLTIVSVLEVCTVISHLNHGGVKPFPALILHGIMVYYCWKRERDFQLPGGLPYFLKKGNCCNQALAQACAVCSPGTGFSAPLSRIMDALLTQYSATQCGATRQWVVHSFSKALVTAACDGLRSTIEPEG